MSALAELRGLSWTPLGRQQPALDRLDLRIAPGERIGLVGPSGAGKSTLIHALAGILGEAIPGELTGEITVNARIGLLLQDPGAGTVADRIGRDVAFGLENAGVPRDQIWRRVRTVLDQVGLEYRLDRPAAALSGGERQRLALAGVLAMRPSLLLLDEPTSMLEATQAETVREAVLDNLAPGAGMLVVDHHIGPWLPHLDRVLVMSAAGNIAHQCAAEALISRYGAELTRAGVWVPGAAPPKPLEVPEALLAPQRPGPQLDLWRLGADLVTRRLRGSTTTTALDGLNARLRGAAHTAITGPSGAGKSTLLALLGGLHPPSRGRITGTATPLHRCRSRELASLAGWVPQNSEHGFVAHSVRDEIATTARILRCSVDIEQILEVFGLGRLADANPYRLSGGEQRRLALAAALAHRPPLVLADEPTVGQDRHTWAAVTGWLTGAAGSGATVVVATHDEHLIGLADHRLELTRGTA